MLSIIVKSFISFLGTSTYWIHSIGDWYINSLFKFFPFSYPFSAVSTWVLFRTTLYAYTNRTPYNWLKVFSCGANCYLGGYMLFYSKLPFKPEIISFMCLAFKLKWFYANVLRLGTSELLGLYLINMWDYFIRSLARLLLLCVGTYISQVFVFFCSLIWKGNIVYSRST